MTPRRPADIAAALREIREDAGWVGIANVAAVDKIIRELFALDAEHVCVPKDRWPTADEIAELRRVARERALDDRSWVALTIIAAFLDRLDPPEAQADDVDWRALLAAVVTDELLTVAEVKRRIAAARAALDARGQS